ncbi:hypothetical protein [Streptomyces sp. NPDC002265]|uniref:hypothetical protein n=1 Tax=Streptomyces sp. NPDC002265 TaxID=3154415 RepID=UPI0033210E8F
MSGKPAVDGTTRRLTGSGYHDHNPNRVLTVGRAPVEHGFAHLKNWRILTKLRTNPTAPRASRMPCSS